MDCLGACTSVASVNADNTCANKCASQKNAFDCCVGCERNAYDAGRALVHVKGSCPTDLKRVDCCSATEVFCFSNLLTFS
jgi:hypothetical protein